jgi:SAM-dependent methyltransferase
MRKKKENNFVSQVFPPFLLSLVRSIRKSVKSRLTSQGGSASGNDGFKQDLELYWESSMAEILETWGDGNVWNEIQFLLINCEGRVLDIACGTGKTMEILSQFQNLEITGCDISDYLIEKAIKRGIPEKQLVICDATKTNFEDNYFNYGYSIGSLEHFTETGIVQLLSEGHRIVKGSTFHQIPVSRSGNDEGWLKTHQSFHNNSVEWWLEKYRTVYNRVYVLDSVWEDDISVGKWFICKK